MTTAEQIISCLKKRKEHISTAESCTGGLVAASLVDVSGASEVFEEGYVTYSDRVKHKLLGVSKETLQRYTAVSAQTAGEMAAGAAKQAGTEVAVAVTGYAGPGPAEDGTPAGTVYLGVSAKGETTVRKYQFDGDRNEVRAQAAKEALALVLQCILS